MKRVVRKTKRTLKRETLTEAYEGRALREESEDVLRMAADVPEISHADPVEFDLIRKMVKGHGEQTVLPADCQFGDNDLCYVDASDEIRDAGSDLDSRKTKVASIELRIPATT